ncbi:MAG TPA: GspE/PulE family protein [Acidimicrobiales bacterium]|nr:GspE/PulE family protein [Acidimicrobiales bacterium]
MKLLRKDTTAAPTSGAAGAGAAGNAGEKDIGVLPGGRRLGELLVEARLIRPPQVAAALVQQDGGDKRLGTLLVELGALGERDLTRILAEQLALEVADLRSEAADQQALDLLPESVARSLSALPLRLADGRVQVVVADPSAALEQRLAATMGHPVELLLAPASEVRRAIDNSYRALGGVDRLVQAFEAGEASRARAQAVVQPAEVSTDAPVVQVANLVITQALRDRASDIHIEPQDDLLRVRFRIDGALHDTLALPASIAPALVSRLKIMAGMNIVERRRSQDGQIAMEVDGRSIDIRVATTATIWGEKCVLRLLDKSRALYRLHDLGMPSDTHATFSKMVRSPFGMILCAGPTGSGKTTTLYATLAEINEPHRNIMTIEDPVEYVIPSINQIQTNEQAGLTFATGLKSILRQDPDVILVGEIRDVETARIAVQSALTGHLVLSSLHATDSVSALHRFLDMGIESFLIASSVLGVVGQRLVRRICPSCRALERPSDEELAFWLEGGGSPDKKRFYVGKGCNLCAGTGYQDRVGVYEFLRITPEIKRLVVGWAMQEELQRLAVSQGMRTLRQEAMSLVQQDVTTIAEVIRSIYGL